jgi:radical SAM superfamily enzyme YgiQ (UPF0313 family)
MRVGIISVFTDYHRRGRHHRGVLQPQIGPLIAALLPNDVDVHVVNDTWDDPDWDRDYDLLFLSCLHSDFDRARQISHYWRRRGAKTVLGGTFASTYPHLCAPYFDAVAIGDAESTVPAIHADFSRGRLQPVYVGHPFDHRQLPAPRLELVAKRQVLPLAIEASRGCPFSCDFCALTGIGTRYHSRPAAEVADEIRAAREALRGLAAWPRRHIAIFYDNNIGGTPQALRALCDELAPLNVRWGACVSFNVIRDANLVRELARGGCRCVFVGLESFNQATIEQMRKGHNLLAETRQTIARCRDHGILAMSGLMLSPVTDTLDDIEAIPDKLRECGLHVPAYICFETPFPGTPHFHRLARCREPAFLPNALLRDFNGYTLVTRPRHTTPEEFVAAFRRLHRRVYSLRTRLSKLLHDLPGFIRRGGIVPMLFDIYELFSESGHLPPKRTFITGTDRPPPETVPLTDADFQDEHERQAILAPWRVTDREGRILPQWRSSNQVFTAKGSVLSPMAVASPVRAGSSAAAPAMPLAVPA